MRNYFLILALFSITLSAGCGTSGGSNANADANASNANTTANTAPATTQYADAKSAYDEGSKFFEAGKEEAAIEAFKQAVTMDPDMADAHFKLATAYSLLEQDKEAEAAFKKAVDAYKKVIKADDDNAAAYFNMGRAYNKLNEDEDAEKALQRAVKLNGDDSGYNYELGAILFKLAQYNEAIKPLKKSLEIDPENTRAEELLEKAEDGKKRVEQGIPANVSPGDRKGKRGDSSSNTAGNSATDKPAGNSAPPPPPSNKKPEPKNTPPPRVMQPTKPAAKP